MIVIVVGTDDPMADLIGDLRIGVAVVADLIDVTVGMVVVEAVAVEETGSTTIVETIDMTIEDTADSIVVDTVVIEILDMNEIAVTTEEETKIEVIIGIFGMATATGVEKINVVRIAGCHKDKRMKKISRNNNRFR